MRKCQIISYNQSKYKTESSNQGSGVEEKPSAPSATTYSDIAAGKQSILANIIPKKDPRFR